PAQDLVDAKIYQSFKEIHRGSELKLAVKAVIEETWHINSDKPNEEYLIASELTIDGESPFTLKHIQFPKAKELSFSFSDQPVSVFEGEILVGAIVQTPAEIDPGNYMIPVSFTYQACNDVTCMPPQTITMDVNISVVDFSKQISELNSEIFSEMDLAYTETKIDDDEDSLAGTLESSGLIISLFIVFLGGLALNLTPCVYPLIPITIGYFGGQTEGRTGKLFVLGLFYVLGMALTYSVVGVITSLSGAVFGSLLQNPIVIIGIAAVFVALSLSMFGLYEFKLPDSLVAKAGGARGGVFGAFFMGLTMGIVAAPCIGPFVIGLVTFVAAKGDPVYGFLMFFFLAVGLGFPYLFLALFSGKIKNLPRAGFWMEAVKKIFGFILIGMALYFLGPLLPKDITEYLLPVYGIAIALYLLFIDKVANDIKGFRIFKIVFSIIVIAISAYSLVPGSKQSVNWSKYSEEAYQTALDNNQKILIDFYADWCIPCKELDALTFSDKAVIEKASEFAAFKVDMTKSMSDETERIRKKFNIIGMPTVLIFDTDGVEVERITGFVNAEEFLKMLNTVN
ncbi:MAG: protein-disulfide reductase DsbD, partial [Melioribacteraceae bacterium]|nr:protein-disulfide reductase DsbD [Melioribacteraceae bacterium]